MPPAEQLIAAAVWPCGFFSPQRDYPETAQLMRLLRSIVAGCVRNTLLAVTSLTLADFEAALLRGALAVECFPEYCKARADPRKIAPVGAAASG